MGIATCIACGCDDLHACDGGCTWERVDYEAGLGVCSECAHSVQDWDRGDRTLGEEASLAMDMRDECGADGNVTDARHRSSYDEEAEKIIHDGKTIRIFHHYDIGDQSIYVRPRGDNPVDGKRAAVYCQLMCEEFFGEDKLMTNLGIAAMLVQFYGYQHAPKTNQLAYEIDMYADREDSDHAEILADASLRRDGLRGAMEHHVDG